MTVKTGAFAAGVLTAALFLNTTAFAVSYTDIDSRHWAFDAIDRLSNEGIIVGDSMGNYNPNQRIDKFYAAKTAAKLAGFKYVGASEDEKAYFDRAYAANKDIIERYSSAYSKWDNTAGRELAFLLEREILTVRDLDDFVVKAIDKSEKLQTVEREEYALWLYRIIGGANEEKPEEGELFTDDAEIDEQCREAVYYLRSIGAINAEGSFNPKTMITKAEMAVMTDGILPYTAKKAEEGAVPDDVMQAISSLNEKSPATIIETVTGEIYKAYPTVNAVQLKNSDGIITAYSIGEGAAIYVDGYVKTIWDVREGMRAVCSVNNSRISNMTLTTDADAAGQRLSTIEGEITAINDSEAGRSITVSIKGLKQSDVINKTYYIGEGCTFKKNGVDIPFSGLIEGNSFVGGVSGNSIYQINMDGSIKNVTNAVITDKNGDYARGISSVEATASDGTVITLTDYEGADMKHAGGDPIESFSSLYIGDVVDIAAENGRVIALTVLERKQTEATGYVSSMFISAEELKIGVRSSADETAKAEEYTVNMDQDEFCKITLDSKVRLKLVGREAVGIAELKKATKPRRYANGIIYSLDADYINVVPAAGSTNFTRIYIDEDTVIKDASGSLKEKAKANDYVNICIRTEGDRLIANSVVVVNE